MILFVYIVYTYSGYEKDKNKNIKLYHYYIELSIY